MGEKGHLHYIWTKDILKVNKREITFLFLNIMSLMSVACLPSLNSRNKISLLNFKKINC